MKAAFALVGLAALAACSGGSTPSMMAPMQPPPAAAQPEAPPPPRPAATAARTSVKEYSIMEYTGGALRVRIERDGDRVVESVTNDYRCAVTIDATRTLTNLREAAPPPGTVTIGAGATVAIAEFTIIDARARWGEHTSFVEEFGDPSVEPSAYVYALPFTAGETYPVGQGFSGAFSHTGDSEYAVDFTMPEGTTIRAARDGLVIATHATATTGGTSANQDRTHANWIYILHSDGTLGTYWHLAPGGVSVEPGTTVKRGDLIGTSGFTGYAQVPHLHFAVLRAASGGHTHTFPFVFKTTAKDKRGSRPVELQRYTAFE